MSTEKYPWQQWQLTAFVLDELEPDVAAQIHLAADSDPSLAAEITAIRETITQVTQLYKNETAGIDPTTFAPVAAASESGDSFLTPSAKDPVVFRRIAYVKTNWARAVGLIAMAGSLLLAVVLAAPSVQTYFAQPTDVLAHADDAQRIATAEAKNRVLTRSLEEAKAELSKLQVVRPSTSSAQVPATSLPELTEESELQVAPSSEFAAAKNLDVASARATSSLQSSPTEKNMTRSNMTRSSDPAVDGSVKDVVQRPAVEVERVRPNVALAGVENDQPAPGGYVDELVDRINRLKKETMGQSDSPYLEAGKDSAPQVNPYLESKAKDAEVGLGYPQPGGSRDAKENKPAISESLPASSAGGMRGGGMMGGTRGGMGEVGESRAYGMGSGTTMSLATLPPASDSPQPDRLHDDSQPFAGLDHKVLERYGRQPSTRELGTDRYAPIYENPFKFVESDPLTTFSIDVDTASYVKTRQFLTQSHSLPPANAVRVEEFINYFEYEYAGPQGDDPFAANLAVATCPWRTDHKLVRIALQAKKIDINERPKANIVFLLDVSGSMDEPNKLPLVKESMRMLVQQLGENDRVAMVVYAGAAGCVLESTTGEKQDVILGALDRLNAGGSTNGGQGIQLAYDIARDHFVPGGVNRVILCTDGDFNVGTTSTDGLVNLVVEKAKSKVFLTVLGFGMGNTNDAMMEQISNKGNGVYGFVDSRREAQRQMVKQLAGNLMTVAKDVKIQVEFNPERVASYRLIGYENRKLANEDFANDKKDAGEIGAGHRVTALYEIEPIGAAKVQPAEGLRYQRRKSEVAAEQPAKPNDEGHNELLAVNLRYKQPEGDTSKLLTFPLVDANKPFSEADQDFKWAASVAQFAMLLRNSTHKGNTSWSGLLETAESLATDESRRECVNMMRSAAGLSGR